MPERMQLPAGISPALRERFDRLSPGDQARLLARFGGRNAGDRKFHIARRSEVRAPLTCAQQGVWFRHLLSPQSSVWNLSRSWTVSGRLDLTALERALSEIVRRHESLRTRYVVVGGEPVQEVMPASAVAVEILDATDPVSGVPRGAHFRRTLAALPFDLSLPVMVRAGVAILAPQQCEMTITRHHICSDQWSSGIFRRELSTVYGDFVAARESSLPDLHLQFNDYAWWENDAARNGSTTAGLAEAIEALQGIPEESALISSSGRNRSASGPGGRVNGVIPAHVVGALRQLALSHDATLFMALMTIFNTLICRRTNQRDLVVLTPTAGRVHPDLESLIGMFANVLPLRTDLTGDPSFLDLLERTRRGTTRLFAHQHVPIQRLQAAVRPGSSDRRLMMSSLLFALQNVPRDDLRLAGADTQSIESGAHDVFEDLALFATEDGDGSVTLRADYRADRVDEPTIRRIVDDFAVIAARVVDQPSMRLSDLPLHVPASTIPRPQRNDGITDYARDSCVQELVEAQVERTPDAIAVVNGDMRVTYRELNLRANRLANHLRTNGAVPDAVVGLCLGRSVDLVIAILAILKSGAAYVPLDSTLPDERLQYMVKESGAVLCVASGALAHRFADAAVPVINIDADRAAIDAMPAGNLARAGEAEDLAYVMFTSGSTGRPKGVAMPHRPLVNLLSWHQCHPRLGHPARTLQFAPVSFDVSFQDIVATWCTGGTVVMIGDDARRDPMALRRFVEANEIERLYLPAVALKSLGQAHAASPGPLKCLRDIIAAGEALHVTPEIRRLATDSGCHLHNHYGPTEAHVVTAHELDGPADIWPPVVPIGRPLPNVHIEILNDDRQRADAGVAGEIHIGGDCLARGYQGRPDLTAERFIDDPFRQEQRLYRTGDRGRRRPDGVIEFLGRLDDQVKLHGYRVEPGEVEAVMAECAGVSQAVVVVREDHPGDKRLVGYYVASAAGAVLPGTLQAQLRQRLPRVMLPAALVELTALPVSPNGKVDRDALPRPSTERAAGDGAAPPNDAVEASLVALWCSVLNRAGIGIDDNFFDLGGHSILAATMLLRAEQALGRGPGLNVLFEGPTIRQLAHAFRGHRNRSPRMVLTWITDAAPGEDRGRPPLIVMPSMFGAVDEWRVFFRGLDVDRPIYGLELLTDYSYWTDQPDMQQIAARCVEVLLRDLNTRRFHLIGHSFGGRLAYEVGQQLSAAGVAPVSIVIMDTPATGSPRRKGWADLRSMVSNAPRWMMNELQVYGAAALAGRIRNRWRFRLQAHDGGLDRVFEMSQFPEHWRRRLLDSHRAFTAYRARPTGNRVVYLRSRVRSLVHLHRPDGNWGELVPAPCLTVVAIPGDHGSVLDPRWRPDVSSTIRQVLEQGDR